MRDKVTEQTIRSMKGRRKIPALTAYDFAMTKLLDEIGVPFIHVGDTLGMMVLGYPDTTWVTMPEMEHHTRAAARAKPSALLVSDLPYLTYETPAAAVENAQRLVAAGAEAVKAEGGRTILSQARAIVAAGIPFCGHLGMLPQHVLEEGGYRMKGKKPGERESLISDARALAEAGAFAIVLEIVAPPVAREITESIPIPTIGIASGNECDGAILVTPDLLGTYPWFRPKFVTPRMDGASQIREAVRGWMNSL